MATKKEIITAKAIEIIKSNFDGIPYSEIVANIQQAFPEIPMGTITGTIWNLDTRIPNEVYKPARGLFRHVSFKEMTETEQEIEPIAEKVKEEDFYESFADWLVNELEECTKAIALGGNKFRDKWGTPDIIGIREPKKSDIIKPNTEIISAEIKIDTGNLITAFGQACSYKIFSHKSYIVIPSKSKEEDVARLDALCRIFGIGLILINISNPQSPQFEIRARANKHEPDMFYVNKYMKLIEDELFS